MDAFYFSDLGQVEICHYVENRKITSSFKFISLIEVGYIEYGNFENCKFDSDLKLKI